MGVLLKLLLLKSHTQINVISKAWKLSEGSKGKLRYTNMLLLQVDSKSLEKWHLKIKKKL